MSSTTGGAVRGRGRGRGAMQQATGATRGASTTRGRGYNNTDTAQRGSSTSRGSFGQTSRNAASGLTRGTARPNGFAKQPARNAGAGAFGTAQARGNWQDRYQALQKDRQRERALAIQQGILADPDKPRKLAEAITPVGTCTEMCAEYERVERVVQKDVWPEETDPTQSAYTSLDREPDESRMVKKFRRAAAGIEEQLPSDLRPPHILKKTCDYLFHEVIRSAPSLGKVHHFVWDRTRAIRNDFSIQQLTKPEDLSIAVECYERIARFHILSLHQLALPEKPYDKYDWQQEKEQLDRTLLSLLQYYDDSRGRIPLPNEAEFRSYEIIFRLDAPDLENDVQCWPKEVLRNARVRKALAIYAAGRNANDLQGPLKPPTSHALAQQDWMRFWNLVSSNGTSYLMACVAERHFNDVRMNALQSITRCIPPQKNGDWSIEEVREMLALDDNEAAEDFCGRFGVEFNQDIIDLSTIKGRPLPSATPALQKQLKSMLVEHKRHRRMLPAVIDGMSVRQAQEAGMVDETDEEMQEEAYHGQEEEGEEMTLEADANDAADDADDNDSLFVTDTAKPKTLPASQPAVAKSSVFGGFNSQPQSTGFSFGKPSPFANATEAKTATTQPSPFSGFKAPEKSDNGAAKELPKFDFLAAGSKASGTSSPFGAPAANSAPSPWSSIAKPATNAEETASTGVQKVNGTPAATDASKISKSPFAFAQPSAKETEKPKTDTSKSPFQPASTTTTSSLFSSAAPTDTKKDTGKSLFQPMTAPPTNVDFGSKDATTKPSRSASTTPKDEPTKSPFTFASPAATAKETSTPSFTQLPETTLNRSLPSFDFAKPKPPIAPSSPAQPSFPASSDNRRPSTSSIFSTKPAVPSPLAQSTEAPKHVTFTGEAGVKSSGTSDLFATTPAPAKQAPKIVKEAPKPQPDLSTILSQIAREITLEPHNGFLDQYVDFVVGQVITDVQEQLYFERLNAEADAFRHNILAHRYGRKWRDTCRRSRLAKHGRDRRKRAMQRLQESKSQASEDGSVLGSESVLSRSIVGSVSGRRAQDARSRRDVVDGMFQQSMSNGRWSKMASSVQQAKAGSKRPSPAEEVEDRAAPRAATHKRFKSVDHIQPSKSLASTKAPNADLLKRSSFLGFSVIGEAGAKSTTQSNYFRRKALGLQPISDSANARARKRQFSELTESTAEPTTIARRVSSPLQRDRSLSGGKVAIRQASISSVKPANNDEEDDALFARLKAARESLKDNTSFFQSEMAKDQLLGQSTASRTSYESPSMARARGEARLRASQGSVNANDHLDVPAYRLRESRFVPREDYAKAIERAREIRESRSREVSRPESRVKQRMLEQFSPSPAVQDSAPRFDEHVQESAPHFETAHEDLPELVTAGMDAKTNGFDFMPSQSPWAAISAPAPIFKPIPQNASCAFGFSQTPSFDSQPPIEDTQPAYEPHPTDNAQSAFNSHQTFGHDVEPFAFKPLEIEETQDHTIKPYQIEESLSQSFGAPGPSFDAQPSFADQPQPSFLDQSRPQLSFVDETTDDSQNHTLVAEQPRVNGMSSHAQSDSPGDTEEDVEATYGHLNPFAALAQEADEDEDDESDAGDGNEGLREEKDTRQRDEVEESDVDVEGSEVEENERGAQAPSYHPQGRRREYSESIEEELEGDDEDDDIDEEEESDDELGSEDEDEDEETFQQRYAAAEEGVSESYDEEEEEDEEDDESDLDDTNRRFALHPAQQWPRSKPLPQAVVNEALVGKGQTETDAIELSD